MRTAYRVLAYLIALEVVVQAAAIAFAVFGLGKWVEDGGVLDKAAMESESINFTGLIGFIVHGINGQLVIPAIALILLIVSFFAKVPKGAAFAGIVLGLIVAQVLLGIFGHGLPALGVLHGMNALAIFTLAVIAARRAGSRPAHAAPHGDAEQQRAMA
jgi:hypothetical protein